MTFTSLYDLVLQFLKAARKILLALWKVLIFYFKKIEKGGSGPNLSACNFLTIKISEIRLHSSCRFLKFWSICFFFSFSWKQKIFVVVFFKVSLKAKISLVEGKFFQDEVMIWGLIYLILSLRQVVTCKANKANTFKSRTRPTDLEWLRMT